MSYEKFVSTKLTRTPPTGLDSVPELHPALFPFQRALVASALRRGRAALFEDCGLGKTLQALSWSDVVAKHTGRPVLILAPLAVAKQTVRESSRFGIAAEYRREHTAFESPIVVANYEMLSHFDTAAFGGVVLDESSILKGFTGKTRNAVIEAFAQTPFRLACTATPAPNDHQELGNHAEFLGVSSRTEMLSEYFVHDASDTGEWRLKGHAHQAFWEWVCSWAVAVRKPSDLEFADDGYNLPGLRIEHHVIAADHADAHASGFLFKMPARSLEEQRRVKRGTISSRAAAAAALVAAEPNQQWIVWVELNDEGDAITDAIPGAVQIAGSDTLEEKESRILDFAEGRTRVLVTKSSIAGFGVNLQSCARMVFASVTHSYEQFFQSVRRCHRFGQTQEVVAHVVCSELETDVLESLRRKEADADRLMTAMVASMRTAQLEAVCGIRTRNVDNYKSPRLEMPSWLGGKAS